MNEKNQMISNNNINNINTKAFALVLHLNCNYLSQSESSNFVMYIINKPIVQYRSELSEPKTRVLDEPLTR